MSDTEGWLCFLVLVGMAASAALWGYWRTKRTMGYLYATYAATVLWIGALLVSLALLGDWRYAVTLGAVLVGVITFAFVRDRRWVDRRSPANRQTGNSTI